METLVAFNVDSIYEIKSNISYLIINNKECDISFNELYKCENEEIKISYLLLKKIFNEIKKIINNLEIKGDVYYDVIKSFNNKCVKIRYKRCNYMIKLVDKDDRKNIKIILTEI